MSQSSARLVSLHLTFNDGISSLVWPKRYVTGYSVLVSILLSISLVTYRRGRKVAVIFSLGLTVNTQVWPLISSIKYSRLCSSQGWAGAPKYSFGCFQSMGRSSQILESLDWKTRKASVSRLRGHFMDCDLNGALSLH